MQSLRQRGLEAVSWQELWAVQRMGSKVSVCISPSGDKIGIGITNMLSLIGVSNGVSIEDARALALTLLDVTGGMPAPAPSAALPPADSPSLCAISRDRAARSVLSTPKETEA